MIFGWQYSRSLISSQFLVHSNFWYAGPVGLKQICIHPASTLMPRSFEVTLSNTMDRSTLLSRLPALGIALTLAASRRKWQGWSTNTYVRVVTIRDAFSDLTAFNDQLNDKELKAWILPNFTTTSHNDTVTCAVYMMATLKAYVIFSDHPLKW